MSFPPEFIERFEQIVPAAQRQVIQTAFDSKPYSIPVRINTLLTDIESVTKYLREKNIEFTPSGICEEVICIQNQSMNTFRDEEWVRNGMLYPLKMASVIPVLELDPQPGERVMDLCAAPGGKTSHIAARMGNDGFLFVVEPIRDRFFKLRANCERTGVKNAIFKQADGRMIRPDREGFDKVLVDAPCSSESRFELKEPKTYAYWSLRKIKEMRKKQIGLIRSGLRCLKPGGTLVYSTCTFAPEENETVIHFILKKFKEEIELLPVNTAKEFQYPFLWEWEGKRFFEFNNNVILRREEAPTPVILTSTLVILSDSEESEVSGRDPSKLLRSAQDDSGRDVQDDKTPFHVILSGSEESNPLSQDPSTPLRSAQDDNKTDAFLDFRFYPSRATSASGLHAQDDRSKKSWGDKAPPPVILSDSEESEILGRDPSPPKDGFVRTTKTSLRSLQDDKGKGMARFVFPQDGSAFFVAKLKKR